MSRYLEQDENLTTSILLWNTQSGNITNILFSIICMVSYLIKTIWDFLKSIGKNTNSSPVQAVPSTNCSWIILILKMLLWRRGRCIQWGFGRFLDLHSGTERLLSILIGGPYSLVWSPRSSCTCISYIQKHLNFLKNGNSSSLFLGGSQGLKKCKNQKEKQSSTCIEPDSTEVSSLYLYS